MSQEIINVLDYIAEKLGIAVDWTAENIWPQVMEILSRYRIYEITCNIGVILMLTALLIGVAVLVTKIIKAHYNAENEMKSNYFWKYTHYHTLSDEINPNGITFVVFFCSAMIIMAALSLLPHTVSDLLKWIIIPEIQILDLLQGYVS